MLLISKPAVVGGLFIAAHSDGGGADPASRVGIASGALVIAVFRNGFGVSTFGTFMPVLIALALRDVQSKPKQARAVMIVGVLGAAMFYGDGMVTPAIKRVTYRINMKRVILRRLVLGIADGIMETLASNGARPAHVEGYERSEWILLDYFDFIVHIFAPETRRFYALERLWGNAETVELGASG